MIGINNMQGTKVKHAKVVHSEKLSNGLYFIVAQRIIYKAAYKSPVYHGSPKLEIEYETFISSKETVTTNNGIILMDDTQKVEQVPLSNDFQPLEVTLKTKKGYTVKNVAFDFKQNEEYKERTVKWVVEVSMDNLLNFVHERK